MFFVLTDVCGAAVESLGGRPLCARLDGGCRSHIDMRADDLVDSVKCRAVVASVYGEEVNDDD